MQLPFSEDQFFAVFRAYNTSLWPFQVVLLALGVWAVVLVLRPGRRSGTAVSALLAFLWAWMGLAYHLAFFAPISPPAYAFSAMFVAGAFVFLWQGVVRRRLEFSWTLGARGVTGLVLVVYALAVYPAWSHFAGRPYLESPTFGLPCPTTIFTMGLLAFLEKPCPRSVYVVPILWSVVGVQAAFLLSVPQDLALAVVMVVGLALISRAGSTHAGAAGRPRVAP